MKAESEFEWKIHVSIFVARFSYNNGTSSAKRGTVPIKGFSFYVFKEHLRHVYLRLKVVPNTYLIPKNGFYSRQTEEGGSWQYREWMKL